MDKGLFCINVLKLIILIPTVWSPVVVFDVINQPLFSIECLVIAFCILDLLFAVKRSNDFKISIVCAGLAINVFLVIGFHALAVLYGAPVYESFTETVHLSLLLTAFTTLPCCLVLGVNSFPWFDKDLMTSGSAETSVIWSSGCSLLFAWLGAFVIPLDWDRPWQEWPVSCTMGACIGQACGLIIGTLQSSQKKYDSKHKLG